MTAHCNYILLFLLLFFINCNGQENKNINQIVNENKKEIMSNKIKNLLELELSKGVSTSNSQGESPNFEIDENYFLLTIPILKDNLIKNVSIDLNAAYVETTNLDNVDDYQKSSDASKNEIYGLYKPYEKNFKNFKLGGNISYHNPTLGLIISVRSEHFIIDDIFYNQDKLPYAFIDKNFEKHIIPEQDRGDLIKYGHLQNGGGFNEDRKQDRLYHNFHLRISKDFLSGFRFSFYVNNFMNLRPTQNYREGSGTSIIRVNPQVVNLSFGTKIEFKF